MAAPTATERLTPGGIPLRDGYATLITFEDDPDISLWEKATTPPGMDNGDPIDVSTFHNTTYRTKWPRVLTEVSNGQFTCGYDPDVIDQIIAIIGNNQTITVTFNDESTLAFWGYLKSFAPQEHTDGAMPEAQVEFVVTNLDDSFAEQAPVVSSVAGT